MKTQKNSNIKYEARIPLKKNLDKILHDSMKLAISHDSEDPNIVFPISEGTNYINGLNRTRTKKHAYCAFARTAIFKEKTE